MPKAIWNDTVIAESDDTVIVEGNHYFPADSVRQDLLQDSDRHTVCPWKGTASYYDVVVGRRDQRGRRLVLPRDQARGRSHHRPGRVLARGQRRGVSVSSASRLYRLGRWRDDADLIVIGAGMAGINAAGRAAEADARVVVIERDRVGGTCPVRGCIPSKALIRSAEIAHEVRTASEYGIRVEGVSVDFGAVIDRVQRIVDLGSASAARLPRVAAERPPGARARRASRSRASSRSTASGCARRG